MASCRSARILHTYYTSYSLGFLDGQGRFLGVTRLELRTEVWPQRRGRGLPALQAGGEAMLGGAGSMSRRSRQPGAPPRPPAFPGLGVPIRGETKLLVLIPEKTAPPELKTPSPYRLDQRRAEFCFGAPALSPSFTPAGGNPWVAGEGCFAKPQLEAASEIQGVMRRGRRGMAWLYS